MCTGLTALFCQTNIQTKPQNQFTPLLLQGVVRPPGPAAVQTNYSTGTLQLYHVSYNTEHELMNRTRVLGVFFSSDRTS